MRAVREEGIQDGSEIGQLALTREVSGLGGWRVAEGRYQI